MTFGQQPRNGSGFNQQPQSPYQYDQQAPQYQYGGQQYAYAPNGGAAIDAQAAYSYEEAQRVSVTRAYGEMTIGLVITAVVAVLAQMSGAYVAFVQSTGLVGFILFAIVQVGLAVYLGARIMKIKAGTARVMFYVYAALMGFTLSSIFMVYDLGSIAVALGLCAVFFLALTMFGMTTKINMLKAGPILLIGLVVLIVAELVLMLLFPGDTTLMIVSAIGLVLFAAMTVHDAQQTRAIFAQYQSQGPEMVKKVSVVCALNLYLDFVNIFLYILELLGNRD
ncbi:Bax inhibitor-1/YccA family protein [Bifidobacterium phasiani]|uniref:Bax inhibitor-1 family protein n=1 Tax=Bifidobacterium phasiani TaxID=2834431 RepID=A0ABS6W765_9BIFI|nr:Bax inhibitor-1/YccA family protein [Bifidobacterium phasiani]MBW3082346.1 Bax inhibitor-1 family protein [Bifidobacterium phasiani]